MRLPKQVSRRAGMDANNPSALSQLESVYVMLDAYSYLATRYDELTFVDQELAAELREQV